MYIKKDVVFSVVSELTIMNEQIFESLFIVVHFETKSIICGRPTICRPPKIDALSVSNFFDDLKFVLSELKKSKNKSYLMGDLNLNLLDSFQGCAG